MSLFTLSEVMELDLPTEDQLDVLVEEYLVESWTTEMVTQTSSYVARTPTLACPCTYCTINYNPSCQMSGNQNECVGPP